MAQSLITNPVSQSRSHGVYTNEHELKERIPNFIKDSKMEKAFNEWGDFVFDEPRDVYRKTGFVIKDWATYFNVNYYPVLYRIGRGMTLAEVRESKPINQPKEKYENNIAHVCRENNVGYDAVRLRVKNGMSIDDAVNEAVRLKAKRSRYAYLEGTGIPLNKMKHRVNNLKQDEKEAFKVLQLANKGVDAVYNVWEGYAFKDKCELKLLTDFSERGFNRAGYKLIKVGRCGSIKLV